MKVHIKAIIYLKKECFKSDKIKYASSIVLIKNRRS